MMEPGRIIVPALFIDDAGHAMAWPYIQTQLQS
jgi:hypothetical protein